MRVVVDTNVLISAFIATGKSQQVLEHCLLNHTVVCSQFILDELREKLVVKFNYAPDVADEAVALLRSRMELVVPVPLPAPVCRDPDDDQVLATAVTGNCERIITGDKDLLVLNPFGAIQVQNPRSFGTGENLVDKPADNP